MTKIITQTAEILAFAESEYRNPYLKYVKFIFADDKPNINRHAIPYDEFETLKASIVGMPIKMRFLGSRGGAGAHDGSIPIGHIQNVTEDETDDGTHRIIAEGALYSKEYPDMIEYLEEAFAANEAPGISWELTYQESVIDKGITFLKGIVARAATFVKHPAYGKRTALLALASDASLTDEEMEQEVVSLFAKEPEPKGGTENVELEEALAKIKELQDELSAKATEIEALTATAAKVPELEATVTELQTTITTYQKDVLIAARTQKMVEAGVVLETDEEKLAQKQELWAAMSEEMFEELVSTVSAVAKKAPKKAEAAAERPFTLPRVSVDTSNSGQGSNILDRMRALGRNPEPAE